MALTPRHVFRYFKTDGVPSSGKHNPVKAEIIQLLEQLFGVSRGGWVVAQTRAALLSVTPEDENDGGVVLDDPNPAYNGYYSRVAGVWDFGRGFPDTFASVTLTGSGTAQTGTVKPGVSPASIEVFFAEVTTPNTGPLKLTVGGVQRDVLNAAGNPLSPGEWTGGVMFRINPAGKFQLINEAGAAVASAANATRAEDAADRSEAAAEAAQAAGANEFAATRAALKALDTSTYSHVYLTEENEEGQFVWRLGDYNVKVTADTDEHNYLEADGIAASTGAWVRVDLKAGGTIRGDLKMPALANALVLADQDGLLTQWGNPQQINLQLSRDIGDADANTALMAAAFDALTTGGGGVIKLPAGRFSLNDEIAKELASDGSIVIDGAGKYSTQLLWTGSSGGFDITYPDGGYWMPRQGASFSAANLSMVTQAAGLHKAFALDGRSALGRPMMQTNFINVAMMGDTADDFWLGGWSMDSVCNATITDSDYAGKQGEGSNTMIDLTATGLPDGGTFEHTYKGLRGVYCAAVLAISGNGVEGIVLDGGHFTGSINGVIVANRCLQLAISKSHFACTGMPFNLTGAENFVLKDSLIFNNTADTVGLQNDGGGLSHISGNTFIANAGGGYGMVLAGENTYGPSIVSENIEVGYGVGIQLQPSSKGYMIGPNFTSGVSTPFNDLSTPGDNEVY